MKNKLIICFILVSCLSFAQNLTTSGSVIVNDSNEEVLLRGYGPGGWQIMEGYMMQTSGFAGTQHEIKEKLIDLIGEENTETFFTEWRANHFTQRDVDSLAAWGFNSIRIPMHYNLFTLPIQEESVAGENTWIETGFELIDDVLSWAAPHNMYVILDMHATPGGQGSASPEINDYNPAYPSLWESQENKDKLVALWTRIADRYKNNAWIGGYDLINETHWNLPGNTALRELYVDITEGIRSVDTNHILFIEGNWYANDFGGLASPWDDNMVYSFHKYWTYNDTASIQWVLDIRNQQNVPIWMGESGENSNTWFTDAVSLFEDNNIGWAWWAVRKIGSINSPYAIDINPGYQAILDYWQGNGSQPTATDAFDAMMQLADNLLVDNSRFRKDVPDALIRQPHTDETIPYKGEPAAIPGVVHLSDFDLGKNNFAYYDTVVADYHISTNEFWAWNSGWTYRNDGVDIDENTDTVNSNGYHIGYVQDQEWLKYTVNIDQPGLYDIAVRYASVQSFGKIKMYLDDADITENITLYNSGGWDNFINRTINNVYLPAGIHTLKLKIVGNIEFNLSSLEFIQSNDPTPPFQALGATTLDDEQTIAVSLNHPLDIQAIELDQYDIKINGVSKPIQSIEVDSNNDRVLIIKLEGFLYHQDNITIDHIGEVLLSIFNDTLPELINFPVVNELPSRFYIPGKIEAEDYNNQSGLGTENTSDAGGGLNIGWTDNGDYAEYPVYIDKTGIYDLHFRAAGFSQGLIEIELINNATTQSIGSFATPSTNGWQSWQTSSHEATLDAGVYTLKLNILQSGFNLNWFEFEYSDQNLSVEEIELEIDDIVKVYPNPVKEVLNINTRSYQIKDVNIYDVNGRLILENNINNHASDVKLKIPQISPGIYLLSIETNKGILFKRLIKQ